jgi:hypothetical protein
VQLFAVPEVASAEPTPLPPTQTDFFSVGSAWDANDAWTLDTAYRSFRMADDASRPLRYSGLRARMGRTGAYSGVGLKSRKARWLPATSSDPWTFGARNWRYSAEGGLDVTLGSDDIISPVWGASSRLGGVSISQTSVVDSTEAGSWRYALAVGALDYAPGPAQGDLSYGPTASSSVLSYGLSPQLTLESQIEVAPDLMTTGLGGHYRSKRLGALSLGVARAQHEVQQGWRYKTAYEVDLIDDLQLSWISERHDSGYADLSRYRDMGATDGGVRHEWTATMGLGRWGDLTGSYENARSFGGEARRSFGLTQQFWYSPNLRIGVRAERESVSGDYDIAVRFSVPIY